LLVEKTLFFQPTIHSNSKFQVFATKAFRSEKSTETSDNSTEVSGKINKTFESVTISPIFLLKSVGRVVRWSPLLTLSPKSSSPKQARKEEQKIKVLPGDQESESNFSRNQQPKIRARISRVILSDQNFGFYKKHTKSHPKFRLSGNRRNFRNYCVLII
jgi:hypothetical protein